MPKMHVDLKNIMNQLTTSMPADEEQILKDITRAGLEGELTIDGEKITPEALITKLPKDYKDYMQTYFHQGGHISYDTIRLFLMQAGQKSMDEIGEYFVSLNSGEKEHKLELTTINDELHIKGKTLATKIRILNLDDSTENVKEMDIDYHVKLYKSATGKIGFNWEKMEVSSNDMPQEIINLLKNGEETYQKVIKTDFKNSYIDYVRQLPSDWDNLDKDDSSVNEVDSKLDRLMELDPQTRFDITQQLINLKKDEVPISNKLIAELLENYPVLEPLYAEKTNNLPHDLQVDNKLDNGKQKIAMAFVAAIALSAALLAFGFLSGGIIPIIIGSIIGGMASLTTTFPNRGNHSNSKEEIVEPTENPLSDDTTVNPEENKGRLLARLKNLEKIKGHKPNISFSTETPLDQPNTPENNDGNNDRKPRGTSI